MLKYLSTIIFLLLFSLTSTNSAAQKKDTSTPMIISSGQLCTRTNTDTLEFSNHKGYKPAHSRISSNQLSLNFSNAYYSAFPQVQIKVPIIIVFELTISDRGEINSVQILRSLLPEDTDDKLITLIEEVTTGTWEPAVYKNKKLDGQVVLPIKILPKTQKLKSNNRDN
ncbi:hypothetical protein [Myroides pelagicus]|uniref:TonB C-terminal domain-containing protein n=1 Tax=Myroides pelagicus TaxID=270914 RepID=A0A7K1GLD0_9FLAO|nr:hypothetical protein [Myroides pelagicus]MEC4112573.1 hypothetical protein [Myroides pelagicus]MTH29550.1 hypothetical protein [Myroides pelagicus]